MKLNKPSILLFALSFFYSISFSQVLIPEVNQGFNEINPQSTESCGSSAIHERLMNTDPEYAQKMIDFRAEAQQYAANSHSRSVTIFKIPIVVHVMSANNNLTEITEEQAISMIEFLNDQYRKIPGSIGDGNGVDAEVEFVLAVRDPDGNCTSAITYTDMTSYSDYMNYGVKYNGTLGMDELDLKSIIRWDPTQYYNIWLVSEIDDNNAGAGIHGFAYFAGAHGASYDGTIMLVNAFKNPFSKTLAHELGHAFNLYHTFEEDANGTTCPPNADCTTDGDEVCDTPPHIRSNTCNNTGSNACDGGSSNALFVHNYMDYSPGTCASEFTAGQKVRVTLAADVTRKSFKQSEGNMSLVPPFAADVDFTASKSSVCIGESIKFNDLSGCIPNTFLDVTEWDNISFNWNVTNGGTPLSSTDQNPTFTFNNAGVYDVTLTVTNTHGTSSSTKQGYIIVTSPAIASCTPTSTNEDNFWQTVNNVTFNTINNNTSEYINSAYTDFSCDYNTVVAAGQTYPINISLRSAGTYTEQVEVYIDYNDNGEFENSELVFSGLGSTNSNVVLTGNVSIPTYAVKNKLLRMRVFGEANSITEQKRTCNTNFFIGDVEDYGVFISDDVALVSITASPGNIISNGTNVTFIATPTNGGSSPIYEWYLNGTIISGAAGATYSTSTLLDGDEIYCRMISNMSGVINSPATSNTIIMEVTGPPISEFIVDANAFCSGSSAIFTDASLLDPTSWSWSFEGGTPSTSTSSQPSVLYSTPGLYKVTLTASNSHGTGTTETKMDYIEVFATPPNFCSSFTKTNDDNVFGIGIHNFKLNQINYSFSGANMSHDPAYQDFSCDQITILNQDDSYSISFTGGSYNDQWTRVYIDYNNDGEFVGAEEVLSANSTSGLVTGSFTVPTTSTTDQLVRIRVITDFQSSSTPGACTTPLGYGQVIDFGAIIRPIPCLNVPKPTVIANNQCGASVLTASGTGSFKWSTNETTQSITVANAGTYAVTQTINGCESDPESVVANPKTVPLAPTVTVNNQCGVSQLTASNYTGSIVWSNGATTPTITVTNANTYTVKQTVGGCESPAGSGTSNPKTIPSAPTVTVNNQCGVSQLTASNYTGNVEWSNGATTPTITVTNANTFTVKQTVGGCESPAGSGSSNPTPIPSISTGNINHPTTCSGADGSIEILGTGSGMIEWTVNGNTNSISHSLPFTIPNLSAGSYSITFDNGCISNPILADLISPSTPTAPTITVNNLCGSSELTASSYTGSILWSTGETTPTITVTNANTYTVKQTVGGCESPVTSGTTAPKAIPSAPTVTVDDQCGESELTASNYTGSLEWSTNETTPAITVSNAGTYTVKQTIDGCESPLTSGTTTPMAIPSAPTVTVDDQCDESVLTVSGSGIFQWSTGETGTSITVNQTGTYTVTQTIGGCTGPNGIGETLLLKDNLVLDNTITALDNTLTANENDATYQWVNCGDNSIIPGANSNTFTPDNDGSYKVILTSTVCTDIVSESGCIIVSTIAIEDMEIEGLKIYPNPTTDRLYIESSSVKIQSVILRDMTGKLIYHSDTINGKCQINLNAFALGTYMLEVNTDNGSSIHKIVKINQ